MLDSGLFWVVLGTVLLIAEVFVSGFFLFFFALAAFCVTGAVVFLHPPLWVNVLLFAAFALTGVVFARPKVVFGFREPKDAAEKVNPDPVRVGDTGITLSHYNPGEVGRQAKINGLFWEIRSDQPLQKGQAVRVTKVNSGVVEVEPVKSN